MKLAFKVVGSLGVFSLFLGLASLDSANITLPVIFTGLGLVFLITSALSEADLWNERI